MTLTPKWQKLTLAPPLSPNSVCVLGVPLEIETVDLKPFKALLTINELDRAERFVFPVHKARFILCRGILRRLLGFYLSKDQQAVEICAGKNGKLYLGDDKGSGIRFNLTHSKDLAVFAFSIGLESGVDIENVDRERATEEVALRYFSSKERSDLAQIPQSERVEAFYRCWTRKEAYLKARGDGLSIDLAGFDVSVNDESNPGLHAEDRARWTMYSLNPADGYVGAIVFEGRSPKVSTYWMEPYALQNSLHNNSRP